MKENIALPSYHDHRNCRGMFKKLLFIIINELF